MKARRHPCAELRAYLRILAGGADRGQFFDVRWATPAGGMNRQFIPARRIDDAALLVRRMAPSTDVYVGAALRDGRVSGGRSAIAGSHLLYIECDDPQANKRLATFAHPPTMEIASGTPGHLQLYWRLRDRRANQEVESANRRLALALCGDRTAVDIARVLRPPETFNHKHDPPRAVRLTVHRGAARYTLAELTRGLPHDPHRRDAGLLGGQPLGITRTRQDRDLLAIPAAEYVRVLTARSPNRAGKVLCPFHSEIAPSLQLYPDGTFYCFGSGCGRGRTIYDFAAGLWLSGQSSDTPLRGQQFIELRRCLGRRFGLT